MLSFEKHHLGWHLSHHRPLGQVACRMGFRAGWAHNRNRQAMILPTGHMGYPASFSHSAASGWRIAWRMGLRANPAQSS